MSDRELLENAAKAEGRTLQYMTIIRRSGQEKFIACWNPLTDDGDALRLAVKLGIRVWPQSEGASAALGKEGRWVDEWSTDVPAATRRAIVRAAAALSGAGTRTASDE